MKYMIIAGEASGDLHASGLITALRHHDPESQFCFFGGDLMAKAAGIEPRLHYNEMNVMGFSEVFRKLPQLLKHLKIAKSLLSEFRPDVLILVDYPSFNLKLAKAAKAMGIPVHYFISPKIWAWKEFRIKAIKRDVDAMYSILPFEVAYYKKHDYKVTYVGNPSVQEMDYALGHMPPIKHFFERQGITDQRRIIALLPGSRKGEIRNNLPLMIEAAKRFPEFQYIVAAAPTIPLRFYRQVAQDPGLNVVFGCTPMLVKHATAALVTSGTATLETALLGTPQVVCYRSNGKRLAYKIMEKLLKVKYVSLPNLILGNEIVPELLVHRCTVESISRNLTPLLVASPQRDWQIGGYKAMRRKLGTQSAADYTALLICQSLGVEIDSTALEEPSAPKKRRRPRPKPTDVE
jgi:lipid-A-disaccharide synthase